MRMHIGTRLFGNLSLVVISRWIITGLSALMCSLGLSLLAVAYYQVGTLLGHSSDSFYGWVLTGIGACLAVFEFRRERGFIAGPLASIMVIELAFLTLSFFSGHHPVDIARLAIQSSVLFLAGVTALYALAVVIGIPSVLALRRLELISGFHYALAGISVGLLLGLAARLIITARVVTVVMHDGQPPILYSSFLYMLSGVFVILPSYLCCWLAADDIRPHSDRA
jgi:hypothetical protein